MYKSKKSKKGVSVKAAQLAAHFCLILIVGASHARDDYQAKTVASMARSYGDFKHLIDSTQTDCNGDTGSCDQVAG